MVFIGFAWFATFLADSSSSLVFTVGKSLESVRRHAPYQLGKGGAFPSYALSNLSGNLARIRQRLARLLDAPGSGPAVEGGR